jgi:hypothetical protein
MLKFATRLADSFQGMTRHILEYLQKISINLAAGFANSRLSQ